MYINELPTQEFLKECFIYDKELGKLFWNHRPAHHFSTSSSKKQWDTAYAGKLAGMVKNNYMHVSINGKCYQNSRIIWKLEYGTDPLMVDHIDNDPLNDKLENLREVNINQSNQNRVSKQINATSSKKGVSFRPSTNRYRAQIQVDGITIELGSFINEDDAYDAYCRAAKHFHGEFANYGGYIDVATIGEYTKLDNYVKSEMDYDYAVECFDYNPETGELFTIPRPLFHFENIEKMKKYNLVNNYKLVKDPASSGYRVKIDGKNYYAHRIAVLLMTKSNPEYLIEHMNGNKFDNRWVNLKIINKPEKKVIKKVPLSELSNDYILECIDIDPITGIAKFKERPLEHFNDNKALMKTVNSYCAGREINSVNSNGYIRFTINGSTYLLHRVMNKLKTGEDTTLMIDHIDGNKLNNAWDNLRVASNKENSRNTKKRSNNTTGFKGVSKSGNKYMANIKTDYKNHHLGLFDTPEEAHAAYCEAAVELHGEFANFG